MDMNENKKENNLNLESFKVFHEITNAYSKSGLDNTFVSFLFCDIPYIVFGTIEKSIISYDLNNLSIVTEIKMAHDDVISKFRQYQKNVNSYNYKYLNMKEDNR